MGISRIHMDGNSPAMKWQTSALRSKKQKRLESRYWCLPILRITGIQPWCSFLEATSRKSTQPAKRILLAEESERCEAYQFWCLCSSHWVCLAHLLSLLTARLPSRIEITSCCGKMRIGAFL